MTDAPDCKNSPKFACLICHYSCSKQSDLNKHNNSKKHLTLTNTVNQLTKKDYISPYELSSKSSFIKQKNYTCDCGKNYKHRQSLHNHKKICSNVKNDSQNVVQQYDPQKADVTELIVTIMKQMMSEQQCFMKDMMTEIIKNGTHNTTNNVNNNSHNKTFNLQFFLNETCKNAMNLTDFVDSIKLQLSDLIKIGEVGYVEGISNIITTNLQALDITERPIHCADKKREVVYIKDEDKWEKEDDNKNKLRKLIKRVAYKNEKLLPQFKEKYPGYNTSESPHSDQYSKIVIEAMGGIGNDDRAKEDKIIRNISKVTTIDKEKLNLEIN